ncbi:hypothetical protein [Stenotrophomonas sp.]|uniref:hypothetical protein n=1 Tax=Stenotrophomonas sp. TaxID=69392 RepID=UPI0028B19491|nr:hypothetical protein [Stenotrophomonas sp.]
MVIVNDHREGDHHLGNKHSGGSMTRRFARNEQQMLSLAEKILAARHAAPGLAERLAGSHVTSDDRKAIIEVIAAELCERGFGAESEPSAYGHALERLIDYLNRPKPTPL